MRVSELLIGKNFSEAANIKATAHLSDAVGDFEQKDELTYKVLSLNKIDQGIEVFVKAWRGDVPVGFGKDGDIEIERFRIFNPPIAVLDPDGALNRYSNSREGKKEYRLREDPAEALRQTLVHSIGLVAKSGERVIPGKIGNTVDTLFPAAGASSPVDGRLWTGSSAWAILRASATGTAETSDSSGTNFGASKWGAGASDFDLYRAAFCFDTSVVGTDTISSAVLSIYKDNGAARNTNTVAAHIVALTLGSTSTLATTDYSILNFGGTSFASIDFSAIATNAYNDFTLNASGIANINKTGVTTFGGMNSIDFLNGSAPTGNNDISIFYADQAGTTNDPKLVVTHAAAAAATGRKLSLLGAGL